MSFLRRWWNKIKYGIRAEKAKEKEIGIIEIKDDKVNIKRIERQDVDKYKPEYFRSNYWIDAKTGEHRRIQIIPSDEKLTQEQWKIVYRYNILYGLKKEYDQSYIILPKNSKHFEEDIKKMFEDIGQYKEVKLTRKEEKKVIKEVDFIIEHYPKEATLTPEMKREMLQNKLQERLWIKIKSRLKDYVSEKEVDMKKRIERLKSMKRLPDAVEQKLQAIMDKHDVDRDEAWDFYAE